MTPRELLPSVGAPQEASPARRSRQLLRMADLRRKLGGVDASTIYRWERNRASTGFPVRVPLGANSVGWYEDEIDAWLERRRAEWR